MVNIITLQVAAYAVDRVTCQTVSEVFKVVAERRLGPDEDMAGHALIGVAFNAIGCNDRGLYQ